MFIVWVQFHILLIIQPDLNQLETVGHHQETGEDEYKPELRACRSPYENGHESEDDDGIYGIDHPSVINLPHYFGGCIRV
jgi:hypothetical protein